MGITNRIENIAIAVITAIIVIALTVTIIQVTSIRTLKKEITRLDERNDKQAAQIIELAKIEKYKIENRFDQVKAKDGQVVLSLDNKLSAIAPDSLKMPKFEPEKPKQTFFQRIKFW